MTPRRIFTEAEVSQARTLRAAGIGWYAIGRELRCAEETIRKHFDPAYRERRKAQINANRRGDGPANSRGHRPHKFDIPEAVQADRDRRLIAPRSLSSVLCGDPAPGQSALDKRSNA